MFVLTQYNSASLNKHISQTYRFSPFADAFVEILAAEQTPESGQWFQGTADAVRQVLPHMRDWHIDTLLILSGDHLYRMDYRQFLARHYETNADVTVSVTPCDHALASDFGLLKTDADGRIIEFKEKPKGEELESMRVDTSSLGLSEAEAGARPFLASMGIYVFKYDQLEQLLAEDLSWVDFGREIIPAAIKERNVQAYLFDGYWEDIGTSQPLSREPGSDLHIPNQFVCREEAGFTKLATSRLPKLKSLRFETELVIDAAHKWRRDHELGSWLEADFQACYRFFVPDGSDYYQTSKRCAPICCLFAGLVELRWTASLGLSSIRMRRIGRGAGFSTSKNCRGRWTRNSLLILVWHIIVPKNAVIKEEQLFSFSGQSVVSSLTNLWRPLRPLGLCGDFY